jgi:hypothetical protein
MKNVQMVKGIINVGFFAQLGYVIITCIKILFGSTLFGFVFDFPFTWTYILPTLIIHTSTMVAFIATYKERPSRKALSYSLLLLVTMYACVLMFAKQNGIDDSNYNFIFYANILPEFPYYTELWIPLTFILVVLPTQLFQYGVWRWGRVFISEIGTK